MPFFHFAARPPVSQNGFILFVFANLGMINLPKGMGEEEDDITLIISF